LVNGPGVNSRLRQLAEIPRFAAARLAKLSVYKHLISPGQDLRGSIQVKADYFNFFTSAALPLGWIAS
jgi:hypothetical protein